MRTSRRRWAAGLAGILVAVAAFPNAAAVAAPDPAKPDPLSKVDESVLRATAGTAPAEFFVRLTGKADLDDAALDSAERSAGGSSVRAGRVARTTAVYRAKVRHADRTQHGLRSLLRERKADFTPFWIANVIRVSGDRGLITELAGRSDVAAIEPVSATPLAPTTTQGAALPVFPDLAQIGADKVRSEYGVRGEGVVIGSIDTGVQFDHPALFRKYRGTRPDGTVDHDYNWYDPAGVCGGPTSGACDNMGHGTHTVGTMVGDDGRGATFGVAPGAKWIAAKGCETQYCSDEALLAAGQWMLAPTDRTGANPKPELSPDVINNSWGTRDHLYDEIVEAWVAAGIFPVFSNGNDGLSGCDTAGYPATHPLAYAVGAVGADGKAADFSSRGTASDGSIRPDIAAPGVDTRSSVPGSGYATMSGTSMAAPHVTAAVALLWSAVPNLRRDVATTRELLDATARDVEDLQCGGTAADNNVYGEGILDAYALVTKGSTAALGGVTVTATRTAAKLPDTRVTLTSSQVTRSGRTDAAGTVQLGRVPAGDYTLRVSYFGMQTHTSTVTVPATGAANVTVDLDEHVPWHVVSGTVTDPAGEPVAKAAVSVAGYPEQTFTTGPGGRFKAALPEGDFDLAVDVGGWLTPATVPVSVDGDEKVDVALAAKTDAHGYVAGVAAPKRNNSGRALKLTGDEATAEVALPFPLTFYGETYSSATVHSNGYLAFGKPDAAGGGDNTALPAAAVTAPAVFAFWDDLILDESSTVRTRTAGAEPNRTFWVTWSGAKLKAKPGVRVEFQAVLSEGGAIRVEHLSSGAGPASGAGATVGIQGPPGFTGSSLQISHNQAVLGPDRPFTFHVANAGVLRGTVTDANDGTPVIGATVRVTGPADPGGVPVSTVTDSAGRYQVEAPAATVQTAAAAASYTEASEPATVAESAVTVRNLALRTGRLTADPRVALTVPAGQSRTVSVPIANTGTASATWEVRELDEAVPPAATPGRVLSSFRSGDMPKTYGVGYRNNELLVTDSYFWGQVQRFDTKGRSRGLSRVAADGRFLSDITYLKERDLYCGATISLNGDLPILCFDPDTHEIKHSIPTPGLENPHYGLTYRAADDTFLISGGDQIQRLAGLSHPEPGAVLGGCTPPEPYIAGMALNEKTNTLWAMEQTDGQIYALDPDTCAVQGSLPDPDPSYNSGAGLHLDDDGNLWVVGSYRFPAYRAVVYHVEAGTTKYRDVPWLSVGNPTGELAAGADGALTLTVHTTGLQAGRTYTMNVLLVSNGAKAPAVPVTVTLTVT
ncbi:S8 family serine peptidase [Jidongwangia harbinensis]|uniref:S8 family serine peptidase n=1 Tax=Jidongwangia harbinensis TaxID=2878561 RepID=UPI001CD9BA6A|nr:S8 family serine peptidase [Jidongwangia harbinensis]MCA2217928.1 S8 family serine peptidase [Jidongwangia harbinensis]